MRQDKAIFKPSTIKNGLVRFSFLVPALFFFGFTIVVPFISGFAISFTDWNGFSKEMNYIGLENYKNIFSNTDILIPVKNTVVYAILNTVLGTILSLTFALAINRKFPGRGFVRTAFFLPTSISIVLAVFIWNYIFRDVFKELFGIKNILGSTSLAMLGVVVIHLWIDVGVNMLVFLSALTSVPRELYESAALDGANVFKRFIHVTIPMIMPAITTCVTLSLTYGLKEFATPLTATQGGPIRSTETVAIYIYNHLMSYKEAGYGQALANIFAVVLVVVGATVSGLLRKKETDL